MPLVVVQHIIADHRLIQLIRGNWNLSCLNAIATCRQLARLKTSWPDQPNSCFCRSLNLENLDTLQQLPGAGTNGTRFFFSFMIRVSRHSSSAYSTPQLTLMTPMFSHTAFSPCGSMQMSGQINKHYILHTCLKLVQPQDSSELFEARLCQSYVQGMQRCFVTANAVLLWTCSKDIMCLAPLLIPQWHNPDSHSSFLYGHIVCWNFSAQKLIDEVGHHLFSRKSSHLKRHAEQIICGPIGTFHQQLFERYWRSKSDVPLPTLIEKLAPSQYWKACHQLTAPTSMKFVGFGMTWDASRNSKWESSLLQMLWRLSPEMPVSRSICYTWFHETTTKILKRHLSHNKAFIASSCCDKYREHALHTRYLVQKVCYSCTQ